MEIQFLQPVPRNNWGDNLAKTLPRVIWDELRREVYSRAGHACEICGQTMLTLNAHEDWQYGDKFHVQTLTRIICLCELCHQCVHWFRTEHVIIDGDLPPSYIDEMKSHVMKIMGWTDSELNRQLKRKSYIRDIRNRYDYKLNYGIFTADRVIQEYVRVHR